MNHYTYMITYENGKHYIGVRSCKHSIKEDNSYIGSSKYTPNDSVKIKEILGIFTTREDAVKHEIELHNQFNVSVSPDFYNRSKQTSRKFDTSGVRLNRATEHNEKIRNALTGRKRSAEECANISAGKKGKPHKPHSAESIEKMSKARLGVDGYMKGEIYSHELRQEKYASRVKYPNPYYWINLETGETENMTCVEMGYKYVNGPKPSQRFTNIVRGIKNSYKGWVLDTGKN